jgi:Ca2+-binding EF-hand superfamily protein
VFEDCAVTEMEQVFDSVDYRHLGEINYSEFLTVCIDRKKLLTKSNLKFAFTHFEHDGYISAGSLVECYRREGKTLSNEMVTEIMSQVEH